MYNSTHEYDACVLVNGKPITEVIHNGQIYIEGRKNSVYELQFRNKTDRRVLVVPSVDGLNVLDGKPCGAESGGYVVSAYETLVIPGWKVDDGTAAKFVFKPQGSKNRKDKTYVEAIGQNPENQGAIGFMVFRERLGILRGSLFHSTLPPRYGNPWDDGYYGQPRYRDPWDDGYNGQNEIKCSYSGFSSSSQTMDTNDVSNLGTGFGKATDFQTTSVSFEKASSMPDVIFAFFYDTIQNMKKMGVPTEKFHSKRRTKTTPNPFPKSPTIMGSGCKPPKGWRS